MDDETIAILTLPHNNQLSLIYNETNNLITLTVISFQIVSLVSYWSYLFRLPIFGPQCFIFSYQKLIKHHFLLVTSIS